jgi:glycosyl transferase family 87
LTSAPRPTLLRTALPVVAIIVFVLAVGAIVWSAGSTLGYDFHAYEGAARRILDGRRMYDPSIDVAGGFAIYLYPPPFALAIVPLAIVGGQAAVGIWIGLLVAAFVAAVALLPVRPTVRWLVLLLGALDWPVVYSFKLGQVGPILFLLFAIGWRWLDRPARLGTALGLGTLVKLQPGLLLGWAALTGRSRAVGVAIAVIGGAALLATLVAGTQPWLDYPALLARVSSPLTTPHNFTPGAIAVQAGVPVDVASAIQWASMAGALVAVVVSVRVAGAEASYLVAVVASQLLSPLLWDHYAMLLLLSVAWLLEKRQWWAVAVPLATAIPLVGVVPPAVYPIVFAVCLVAPMVVGRAAGGSEVGRPRLPEMTPDTAR